MCSFVSFTQHVFIGYCLRISPVLQAGNVAVNLAPALMDLPGTKRALSQLEQGVSGKIFCVSRQCWGGGGGGGGGEPRVCHTKGADVSNNSPERWEWTSRS